MIAAVLHLHIGPVPTEPVDQMPSGFGHGHDVTKETLADEIGDCLWYISAICTLMEIELDDVASGNIEKLMRRYPDGFSQSASQNRTE